VKIAVYCIVLAPVQTTAQWHDEDRIQGTNTLWYLFSYHADPLQQFSNLLGTVYGRGNLVFTPDGNSLLSPVGNRVSVFNLTK
jgi:hypothetical protein